MRRSIASLWLYAALSAFILGWWYLAFKDQIECSFSLKPSSSFSSSLETVNLFPLLSSVSREDLYHALAGDSSLMIKWITNWDRDAQHLAESGVKGIKRLSPYLYTQAHLYARVLNKQVEPDLAQQAPSLPFIIDDAGHRINTNKPFIHFLPQTYVAASFLLALVEPTTIVAIPKGLRSLPQLYSPALLNQIPQDLDYYNREKLYLAHPDVAFVAHYSHPSTLHMLHQQGIETCMINNLNTITDIEQALLKVGYLCNRPVKASLLAIFMQACFYMIDNRLLALHQLHYSEGQIKQGLYLQYHQHYLVPTKRCLIGQLLLRALDHHPGISLLIDRESGHWYELITEEEIFCLDPKFLIVANTPSRGFSHWLETTSSLSYLPAIRDRHIFYIDETVQESPTQYIALAYFDIFQALAKAHFYE